MYRQSPAMAPFGGNTGANALALRMGDPDLILFSTIGSVGTLFLGKHNQGLICSSGSEHAPEPEQ